VDLQRGEGRRLIRGVSSGDRGRGRPGTEIELPVGRHVRRRYVLPFHRFFAQAINHDVQVLVLDDSRPGRRQVDWALLPR